MILGIGTDLANIDRIAGTLPVSATVFATACSRR